MTQAAINSLVDELARIYSGHSIALPNGSYPNQCTVPVQGYYVPRITGQPAPSMYADRADGWGVVMPYQLTSFFRHENYQPGKAYPKGTILMWNSPHIAIVMSHNGSNIASVFQQNADPDGSPCKVVNREINNAWHTCNYALIPIVEAPAPAVPQGPPYHVIANYPEGRKIVTNKQPTNKWGMNYAEFSYMAAHPIMSVPKDTPLMMAELLQHDNGRQYYREAGNVDGYNTEDCDDYIPPAPPKTTPAAPLPMKLVENYELLTTVMYFGSAADAQIRKNPISTINKGTYIVYGWLDGVVNITKDNMKSGYWINPKDNVAPVVKAEEPKVAPKITEVITKAAESMPGPAPVVTNDWREQAAKLRANLSLFNLDASPVYYYSTNHEALDIFDMTGRVDEKKQDLAYVTLKPNSHHIAMVGTVDVQDPDGERRRYVLPEKYYGKDMFYLAPMSLFKKERLEGIIQAINDIKASDYLTAAQARIKLAIQGFNSKIKKG